jgi:hypothetical protein
MLLNGVAHVVHGFLGGGVIMFVFGAIYLGVGLMLRREGALGIWLGAILPLPGALAGGQVALTSGDPQIAAYVAINVTVVAICVWLLIQRRGERPSET